MPNNLIAYLPGRASVDKTPTVIFKCRDVEVLFSYGTPWAVSDGVEVSFPDTPTSRTTRKQINAFHPDLPQTRVDPEDFQYLVVSGLMRSLRPLLRRSNGATSDQQERSERSSHVRPSTSRPQEGFGPEGSGLPGSGQPSDGVGG